jgi:hypothetical protein
MLVIAYLQLGCCESSQVMGQMGFKAASHIRPSGIFACKEGVSTTLSTKLQHEH